MALVVFLAESLVCRGPLGRWRYFWVNLIVDSSGLPIQLSFLHSGHNSLASFHFVSSTTHPTALLYAAYIYLSRHSYWLRLQHPPQCWTSRVHVVHVPYAVSFMFPFQFLHLNKLYLTILVKIYTDKNISISNFSSFEKRAHGLNFKILVPCLRQIATWSI